MIKLLYLFKLVDLIGTSQEKLELPADIVNVAGLLV